MPSRTATAVVSVNGTIHSTHKKFYSAVTDDRKGHPYKNRFYRGCGGQRWNGQDRSLRYVRKFDDCPILGLC